MSDHLERLEALVGEVEPKHDRWQLTYVNRGTYELDGVRTTIGDLRDAVAELKRLRAEREGWLNGASQRLRHAYQSGWYDRGESVAAAFAAVAGIASAEQRAAAYAAEWWDLGAALAAEITAATAPQQSEPDGGEQT